MNDWWGQSWIKKLILNTHWCKNTHTTTHTQHETDSTHIVILYFSIKVNFSFFVATPFCQTTRVVCVILGFIFFEMDVYNLISDFILRSTSDFISRSISWVHTCRFCLCTFAPKIKSNRNIFSTLVFSLYLGILESRMDIDLFTDLCIPAAKKQYVTECSMESPFNW